MKLLVVVVVYNGMKWIDRCLGSVSHSSVSADLFVVDNGSTDGSVERIRDKFPLARLIESNQNLGFGRANNLGIRYAIENGYDYVYLLNQDAWVAENTFESLIDILQSHQDYAILSPLQTNATGDLLDRNFLNYACTNELCSDAIFGRLQRIYDCNFVMAAHWMMTRKGIETVGYFSPTFPHYGEDDNYIQRAFYHGFKIGIDTSSTAVHDREFRQASSSFDNYYRYITALKTLSNPNQDINISYFLFKTIIKSFIPYQGLKMKYLYKLLQQANYIKKNREQSKMVGAFNNPD